MENVNKIRAELERLTSYCSILGSLAEAGTSQEQLNAYHLEIVFKDMAKVCREADLLLLDLTEEDDFIDPYDKPLNTDEQWTQAQILNGYYIPRLPKHCIEYSTKAGIFQRYGVKLPHEFQNLGIEYFIEDVYTNNNGEPQNVVFCLKDKRKEGERLNEFYNRVGFPLPPIE